MSLVDKLEGEHAYMIRPVRVSYFDPVTGEPCESKPEPRKREEPKIDLRAWRAAQRAAYAEAREVEDGMRKRRQREKYHRQKEQRQASARGRAVVVDGVRHGSVIDAATSIGVSYRWLLQRLKSGERTCKGHEVAYAEDAR